MIKLKTHIALLLWGIFFFPILFQPLHIARHYANGYQRELSHCCGVSCHRNEDPHGKELSQKENRCPICDYRFSINVLPKVPSPEIIPELISFHFAFVIQQQYKQVFSDKTPRAPPAFIL